MPEAPMLADVLRRPGYLRLLVICGAIGVPVSIAAFVVSEPIDPPRHASSES